MKITTFFPGKSHSNHITTRNVTWYFDSSYTFGTFANGDYWVLGPVTIDSITPVVSEGHHGWQINPEVGSTHAFDNRISNYDSSLMMEFPILCQPGMSVVKTISREPLNSIDPQLRPKLQSAHVLTVVDAPPPNNGKDVFRPPYISTDKPYYFVDSINFDFIPKYGYVDDTPPITQVLDWFRNVQLNHIWGSTNRYTRPLENLPEYGGDIGVRNANAILRLMINTPGPQYDSALIFCLQGGIDNYHIMIQEGEPWPRVGGGEEVGHKILITFFAALLGNEEVKNNVKNTLLYEDLFVAYYSDSISLWGNHGWGIAYPSPVSYWDNQSTGSSSRSVADPYGYIDGGQRPGAFYQGCCTTQPFKGTVTALLLMPALRKIWYPQALIDYIDRWVYFGIWTQPDPCAAFDGNVENEGLTWGPDPNNPSDCIKNGIGRFPELHGTDRDGGLRKSAFQTAMWNAYRRSAEGANTKPPFGAITAPINGQSVNGLVPITISAFSINGLLSVQPVADGNFIGAPITADTTSTTPGIYTLQWNTPEVNNGVHLISAVITDSIGNTYTTKSIEIEVNNSSGQ